MRRDLHSESGLRRIWFGVVTLATILGAVMFLTGWIVAPEKLRVDRTVYRAKALSSAADVAAAKGAPDADGRCGEMGLPADLAEYRCRVWQGSDHVLVLVTE